MVLRDKITGVPLEPEDVEDNDVYCSLCGNPIFSFLPEDAEGNDTDGWAHRDCAMDQ